MTGNALLCRDADEASSDRISWKTPGSFGRCVFSFHGLKRDDGEAVACPTERFMTQPHTPCHGRASAKDFGMQSRILSTR
jgi:hypothetical protein